MTLHVGGDTRAWNPNVTVWARALPPLPNLFLRIVPQLKAGNISKSCWVHSIILLIQFTAHSGLQQPTKDSKNGQMVAPTVSHTFYANASLAEWSERERYVFKLLRNAMQPRERQLEKL